MKSIDAKSIAVGILIGLLLGAGVARVRFERFRDPEKRHARIVARFNSALKLDAGQKGQVEALLKAKHEKMKALHDEVRPRAEELRRSTRAEIRKLLRPEQQEKFDKLEAERDARHARRRKG